jgi:hypothetical protein
MKTAHSDYDVIEREERVGGGESRDGHMTTRRESMFNSWNGLGTGGAYRLAVLVDAVDAEFYPTIEVSGRVMLELEVNGTAVRVALYPDAAKKLGEHLTWLAAEAANVKESRPRG